MNSIRAEPAQQCPNCGNWYRMGHCSHSSSNAEGTLYGVCSNCAEDHDAYGKLMAGDFDSFFNHYRRGTAERAGE